MRVVLAVLVAVSVACLVALNIHRFGGRYILKNSDHADVMVAESSVPTRKVVRVVFIGNSFTFRNDLPAMLANIAASDPFNGVRLEIKAETYPDAHLGEVLTKTEAVSWVRSHPTDYAVLQEHSSWYEYPQGIQNAYTDAGQWTNVLRASNVTPLLFEIWSDGEGSNTYTDPSFCTFGSTPDADSDLAAEKTQELGRQLGLAIVPVGAMFKKVRHTQNAPELLGFDHHHASVAGTYLAALVFYRALTGRTGTTAMYRPWGMSKRDAGLLAQANAE
jgi:hypothetical protein